MGMRRLQDAPRADYHEAVSMASGLDSRKVTAPMSGAQGEHKWVMVRPCPLTGVGRLSGHQWVIVVRQDMAQSELNRALTTCGTFSIAHGG